MVNEHSGSHAPRHELSSHVTKPDDDVIVQLCGQVPFVKQIFGVLFTATFLEEFRKLNACSKFTLLFIPLTEFVLVTFRLLVNVRFDTPSVRVYLVEVVSA
jgi:hypothetical protein